MALHKNSKVELPRKRPVSGAGVSANGRALAKSATGIPGFDEVTGGGLPKGRPTIVCGGPGCGKTMFAVEFLIRGATQFDEPGILRAADAYQRDTRWHLERPEGTKNGT